MRKTVVITLSEKFPQTHPRKGEPTLFREQLGGGKVHTIRGNYDRWKHNIDKINDGRFRLSVRMWQGKAFRSKQEEIVSLDTVGYQRISMNYDPDKDVIKAVIDGKAYKGDMAEIAKNDGLSLQDFKAWFFGKSGGKNYFSGVVIHFTNFRY